MKRLFKKYYLNIIVLLAGTILMSLGGTFFLLSTLGSDALMVFNQGLSKFINTSVGTAIIISNCIAFIVIIFVNRKSIGIGTFAIAFLLGPFINLLISSGIFATPDNYLAKLSMTLLANIVGGTGIALYIYANVGLSPFEGILITIENKKKWRFAYIKIVNDAIFFILGILLGGVFGLGSIITVFIFGPIIDFVKKRLEKTNIILNKKE